MQKTSRSLFQSFRFSAPWATISLAALSLATVACAPQRVTLVPEGQHSIVVSGQGEVYAAPDRARVRLGIEERAASAEEAMNSANQRMTQIIAALKARGVLEKDIQTTELSMYFERLQDTPGYPPDYAPPRPVAPEMGATNEKVAQVATAPAVPKMQGVYVVRNTVLVTIAEIKQVGAYIGAAMGAGANALHGLELTIEDPTVLRNEARKQAVKNAREKAQILAKEAKVKLGPVISVNETGGGEPVPMMAERGMSYKSANVPVATGELSLTQHVQVTFAIEE
jgi:uncharacterized protein YggE